MLFTQRTPLTRSRPHRLEEFLRRRARLQRVEEAVRRNVVIGFFDTLYWSRRFRRHLETKRAGRMTAVPQFTVPEIFVEDEADAGPAARATNEHPTPSFSLTSFDGAGGSAAHAGAVTPPPLDTGAGPRSRANSVQKTRTPSPTRPSPSPSTLHRPSRSDVSGDWQFAAAITPTSAASRPVSPLQPESPEAGRSRASSAVSAQEVLDVLDNSAWGESIRRSFTLRRPSGGQEL